jgi:predicted dehydrogenase
MAAGFAAAFPRSAFSQAIGANNDIRIAIAGIRSKGADHIDTFKKLPGVRIVALCDADRDVLAAQKQKLDKESIKVDGYGDIRQMLERKDVDAIVTATPNHWHSLLTVWACQAGKDVYVEKPVSHEIWEGRKMVEAARKYNRIVQAGTQSRTDPALHEAFDYIRKGGIGKMKVIRGFCYKRRPSIGRVEDVQPIPAAVDYNLWCGPAPMSPLKRKSLHYDWHWFWETGNGDIGNQGIHEMDMCRWVSGHDELPSQVMSIGGRFGYVDDGQTPNTQIVFFDYKPVPVIFEVRGLPMAKDEEGEAMDNYKGARVGIVVECEEGYFSGGGGGGWIFDNSGKKVKQFKGTGGKDHQQNFLDAVRSRKPGDLNAEVEKGHLSSAMCHMGNISHRLGGVKSREEIWERIQGNKELAATFERFEKHLEANKVDIKAQATTLGPVLTMDPAKEQFDKELSAQANAFIKREYREPFVIREKV